MSDCSTANKNVFQKPFPSSPPGTKETVLQMLVSLLFNQQVPKNVFQTPCYSPPISEIIFKAVKKS
jgi:hypothetical protein